MTKTELKKLKELDAFLKERNMKLSGRNVFMIRYYFATSCCVTYLLN